MKPHIHLGEATFANLLVDDKLAYVPSTRPPGAEGGSVLSARHDFLYNVVGGRKRSEVGHSPGAHKVRGSLPSSEVVM
ncbi:hypothetical protein MKX07_000875 [Trichoderma sp. CBMAI-0711]|nr:hypothetical protein MKX07_000875 [Trichoderma sp. CBMAI-0711]